MPKIVLFLWNNWKTS